MGFFDNIAGAFGFGNDAGEDAAALIAEANKKAIGGLRNQFESTSADIRPFIDAGRGGLGEVVQGSTTEGFAERLRQIFGTDVFSDLVDERTRSVRGQLGAGGLTRSGTALQEIADIPTQIGLLLEQIVTGRSQGLADSGRVSAFNLGEFGAEKEKRIADIERGTGEAQASGLLTDAQADAKGTERLLGLVGGAAGGALGAIGGGDGLVRILSGVDQGPLTRGQTALGGAFNGIFFSDPNLKENVRRIGKIADLNLYEWDWIEKTKGTIVDYCGTTGFMADEVRVLYPQHVHEFGGFDVIDYSGLLDELGRAN